MEIHVQTALQLLYIVLFIHRHTFMYKKIQWMRKMIKRRKYILHDTKKVIWVSHRLFVLRCCAVRLGNVSPKFRRKVPLHFEGCESVSQSVHELTTLKTNAVHFFAASRSYYPTTRRNNSDDLLPQYEIKFATNKMFRLCVISSRQSGRFPATLAYLSLQLFFCPSDSLACCTSDKTSFYIVSLEDVENTGYCLLSLAASVQG